MATVVLILGAAAATAGLEWRVNTGESQTLASQARTIKQLETELTALQDYVQAHPEWKTVAAEVRASVVVVETDDDLGSGWVAHSDAKGSDIVTNYHVVESAVAQGITSVEVHRFDKQLVGVITRTDAVNDLAVVHVSETLPALATIRFRPDVGTMVMAVGAPLGLSDSVPVGWVSAYRSIEGGDYMQFTAPISPGNSGGPVIDQQGRVVGITTAKIVYPGAEGLAFAIPVQTACTGLVVCALA